MTKKHVAQWGHTFSGTFNITPYNTDFPLFQIAAKKASDETLSDDEFLEKLSPLVDALPFWTDRTRLTQEIKEARKYYFQDFEQKLKLICENLQSKQFDLLKDVLKTTLTDDDKARLNEVASEFLIKEKTLDEPVCLGSSKSTCKELEKTIKETVNRLKEIDHYTRQRLCDLSPEACYFYLDSDFFIDGLNAIATTAGRLKERKPTEKEKTRPSQNSALWWFIYNLAPVYEGITGNQTWAHNREKDSPFTKFTIKAVELTLKECIPETIDGESTAKYSQKSIKRTVYKVIKFRNFKRDSETGRIPITETTEGMLHALHEDREKQRQQDLDFIKKLKEK